MNSSKQKEVLSYLLTVDTATLMEIYKNVSFSYFYNQSKHMGVVMSRMVKNGTVIRVKRGVFKLKARQTAEADKNQMKLL